MHRLIQGVALVVAGIVTAFPLGAAAQSSLCEDPAARCQSQLGSACLNRIGAGSLPASADADGCEAQFEAYRACLADVSERCGDAVGGTSASRHIGAPSDATLAARLQACSDVVAAVQPFLEKAGPDGRALVASGAPGRLVLAGGILLSDVGEHRRVAGPT